MKENVYQSCILLRDVMLFKFMPRSLTSRLITLPTCDLKHTIPKQTIAHTLGKVQNINWHFLP